MGVGSRCDLPCAGSAAKAPCHPVQRHSGLASFCPCRDVETNPNSPITAAAGLWPRSDYKPAKKIWAQFYE